MILKEDEGYEQRLDIILHFLFSILILYFPSFPNFTVFEILKLKIWIFTTVLRPYPFK